jgi:uncharacterized protein (DUF1499 family)
MNRFFSRFTTVLFTALFTLLFTIALALNLTIAPANAAIFHFSGPRPKNLGVQNGQLAPCPSTPNCISSQAPDVAHQIPPIAASNLTKIKAAIAQIPDATLISETDNYLYAEFTSSLMGFVDDVEFYLDEASGVVQVRSASRLGESDLGANRQRISQIRSML